MDKYEDSWMEPPKPIAWRSEDRSKTPYTIEREKRIQGPLTEWLVWSHHATEEERDEALEKLRSEHPAWHLRPGRYQPMIAIL